MASIAEDDAPVVHIAVGSKNPIKFNASVAGAQRALKNAKILAEGFNVASGIPDQPMGDVQTKLGAENRARNAFEEYFRANNTYPAFAIGLEGGVLLNPESEMECFAYMAVYNGDKFGFSRTCTFCLPHAIRDLVINEGLELGVADDRVFGTSNSKQSSGAVGLLTNGVIDRAAYYEQAVILAFIPFQWPELYP
jgi:inosine/xanthosine triphosphatase